MKLATLCYVIDKNRNSTLMIHRVKKKNDYHRGKWNGLGQPHAATRGASVASAVAVGRLRATAGGLRRPQHLADPPQSGRMAGPGAVSPGTFLGSARKALSLFPFRRRHENVPGNGLRNLRDEDGAGRSPETNPDAPATGIPGASGTKEHHVRAIPRNAADRGTVDSVTR